MQGLDVWQVFDKNKDGKINELEMRVSECLLSECLFNGSGSIAFVVVMPETLSCGLLPGREGDAAEVRRQSGWTYQRDRA
jgi:hypothetical protein